MDFTREPIIETIITPREGCKLVVRSSKSGAQEEYFVDAVEVVSFGSSFFFRSLERPKSFLVPASDYEVLEAREARMVLKNVGLDRKKEQTKKSSSPKNTDAPEQKEAKFEKKRDRRRNYRRRRDNEEGGEEPVTPVTLPFPAPEITDETAAEAAALAAPVVSSLLPPPPSLISDSISKYREDEPADKTPAAEEAKPEKPVRRRRKKVQKVEEAPAEEDPQEEVPVAQEAPVVEEAPVAEEAVVSSENGED